MTQDSGPRVRTVQRTRNYEPPTPGRTRHSASFALDPMKAFTLADLAEASRGLIGADVPLTAHIQLSYGQAIYATWSVEDIQ